MSRSNVYDVVPAMGALYYAVERQRFSGNDSQFCRTIRIISMLRGEWPLMFDRRTPHGEGSGWRGRSSCVARFRRPAVKQSSEEEGMSEKKSLSMDEIVTDRAMGRRATMGLIG